MFYFDFCFILKFGRILCAFSLCDFLSGMICSAQLNKVAEMIAAECKAAATLCAAAAGSVDSQIGLHE